MNDYTARQAVDAYLGGEPVDPFALRAAVAQLIAAYDEIVDLASDVVDDPEDVDASAALRDGCCCTSRRSLKNFWCPPTP